LTQEITGFFIVESHVLTSTSFRSEREIEELWDSLVKGLTLAIENALRTETDPDIFFKVKEALIAFIMTLEVAYCLVSLSKSLTSPLSVIQLRRGITSEFYSAAI
jgi:hypothetical protein